MKKGRQGWLDEEPLDLIQGRSNSGAKVAQIRSMDAHMSRRMALLAGTGAILSVSGCLGDDDDHAVPDGEFSLQEHSEDPPEAIVQYTGEAITEETSEGIQINIRLGGGDESILLDDWRPPITDGDETTIQGNPGYFQPEDELVFIWISADGERQSELSTIRIS